MSSPGKHWYHIILNTHGSWLPGDPRGFRSRKHKIHSSGDYKHPPPKGEHIGLHQYTQDQRTSTVFITPSLRSVIGQTILDKAVSQSHQVLAICVGSNHAHILAELPNDRSWVKLIAGTWKQAASHRVRKVLPGNIWARGCDPIPIRNRPHQLKTFEYILKHHHEGAWVWSFRDGTS